MWFCYIQKYKQIEFEIKNIQYNLYYHFSKMKLFCYNFNKICPTSVWEKLQNSDKWNQRTKQWRGIPCSSVGRFSIFKMLLLPNLIYEFNAIPILLFERTNRSMEQIRKPRNRNRPTLVQLNDLWQRSKGNAMEQR